MQVIQTHLVGTFFIFIASPWNPSVLHRRDAETFKGGHRFLMMPRGDNLSGSYITDCRRIHDGIGDFSINGSKIFRRRTVRRKKKKSNRIQPNLT